MKLFLISWSGNEKGLVDVAANLRSLSHEITYWACFGYERIDKTRFPNTIFHNVFDALEGKPAEGIDTFDFLLPGEDLIKELYETEITVLTMMYKKFPHYSLEERKHLYYHFLWYWRGVLNKLKPDAIIYSGIPHTVYDYVVYSLAKKFGIKIIISEPILGNNGWEIIMNDYKIGSADLISQIKQNGTKQFSLADLKPDTREHYQKHAEIGEDAPPFYLKQDLRRYGGMGLFLTKLRSFWTSLTVLKDFSVFIKVFAYLPMRFGQNLKKEYISVQSPADFEKPYVYATLQYQPEAQTCPQAGVFVDQVLMVETLSSALPAGWFLYVKEHPILWLRRGLRFFDFRYKGYYKEIAKLKNVKLVPVETNSFQLIRHSRAVATGAGSVGWEAILRSRPALIFGYPWYQHCHGVFKVRGTEDCRAALKKINDGFKIPQEKVINFLAALDRASFQGSFDLFDERISKISLAQNVANITGAIDKELKKI